MEKTDSRLNCVTIKRTDYVYVLCVVLYLFTSLTAMPYLIYPHKSDVIILILVCTIICNNIEYIYNKPSAVKKKIVELHAFILIANQNCVIILVTYFYASTYGDCTDDIVCLLLL